MFHFPQISIVLLRISIVCGHGAKPCGCYQFMKELRSQGKVIPAWIMPQRVVSRLATVFDMAISPWLEYASWLRVTEAES